MEIFTYNFQCYKYTYLIERNPIMELFIGGAFILVVGYLLIKSTRSTKTTEAPYKVETPSSDNGIKFAPKEEVQVEAKTTLDPVAVALDLEPVQVAEPAKKPRKPRTPKVAAPKVAKPKAAPKAKATPKARTKSKKV
jgi:hypothetical protein